MIAYTDLRNGKYVKFFHNPPGIIMQERESLSINTNDAAITKSKQHDFAIPASKIASLSFGEIVGVAADDPGEKIKLKMFCSENVNDHNEFKNESSLFVTLPH